MWVVILIIWIGILAFLEFSITKNIKLLGKLWEIHDELFKCGIQYNEF